MEEYVKLFTVAQEDVFKSFGGNKRK